MEEHERAAADARCLRPDEIGHALHGDAGVDHRAAFAQHAIAGVHRERMRGRDHEPPRSDGRPIAAGGRGFLRRCIRTGEQQDRRSRGATEYSGEIHGGD